MPATTGIAQIPPEPCAAARMQVEMPAPLPPDEADRLLALRQSGLLQTGADLRLDALVHRAAMLFNMPIAAITLLDDAIQVFKSSVGVGLPYTSRDLAFCGYTILGDEPFVVPDAHADPRFAGNPLVLGEPGIRFYAGSPVHGPGGQPLGALCVMDTRKVADVTPEQLAALEDLAQQVSDIFSAPPPPFEFKQERQAW
jgi:GAF domain-containing protein